MYLFIRHIHYDMFRLVNCVHHRVVLQLYEKEELKYRHLMCIKDYSSDILLEF